MILPSKHVSEEQSLVGVGAVLIPFLDRPQTVSGLWDKVMDNSSVGNYERYILALDLLNITGVLSLVDGLIVKGGQ